MHVRRRYVVELSDADILRLRLMARLLRFMPSPPPGVRFTPGLVLCLALRLGMDALGKELERATGTQVNAGRAPASRPFPPGV